MRIEYKIIEVNDALTIKEFIELPVRLYKKIMKIFLICMPVLPLLPPNGI